MKSQRLKRQHQKSIHHEKFEYTVDIYPNLRNYYFRSFSTKQEKSLAILHRIECREMGVELKIRVTRANGLIDAWDDVHASFHYLKDSWKHNSKRRTQHYKPNRKKRA